MGVIENFGKIRDKIATKDFNQIEAILPLAQKTVEEVLRRVKHIIDDGGYDELKFNTFDLTETAKELQDYTIKCQREITLNKFKKYSIAETVTLWNKKTDFINNALLISQKMILLAYLVNIIEQESVENNLEYTVLQTLKDFLNGV